MPGVEAVRQQIQNWWQSLAQWQQIAAIGLGIGSLALLLYLTAMAQAPEYAVAYSGLSEQDAAAVVEALKKNNTPYQLDDGGSTIRVPARQVYEVRLALARQGLPKEGTVGFEIFDSGQLGNLGMTDLTAVRSRRSLIWWPAASRTSHHLVLLSWMRKGMCFGVARTTLEGLARNR